MKMPLRVTAGAVVTSVALLGLALPSGATAPKKPTFKIDAIMKNDLNVKTAPGTQLVMGGSSFDGPLVQAAETQWNTDTHKAPFSSYGVTKSGTGRANAISGAYNIGFSDFPLNIAAPDVGPGSSDTSETTANYVQIPVALGGVAIVYHFGVGISGATAALLHKYPLALNGSTLGAIFAGKIKNWDAPNFKAANPHLFSKGKALLPNLPIAVLSRTSGSGTTFGFQDYLSEVDKLDFAAPSANAFTAAAATFANSGLLEAGVQSTNGAIGYVEYGYAVANQTPTIAIVNRSGIHANLSEAGIAAAAAIGLAAINKSAVCKHKFNTTTLACFEINNEVGKTVYPIALFSYAIVKKVQADKTNAISIVKFLDYLSHQGGGKAASKTFGQDLSDANGYAALPVTVQAIARSLISGVTSGGAKVLGATN
jgi:phosphate transport system substrate-binding protein